MSKEAMKLALEALRMPCNFWNKVQFIRVTEAIKSLEEALAKQEQGKSFFKFRECEDSQVNQPKQEYGEQDEFLLRGVLASELKCWHRLTADESQNLIDFVKNMGAKQEQGEPVAWGNLANWCLDSDRVLITDKDAAEKYHRDIYDLTPLYTTQQQRTWVGLTEPEVDECYESIMFDPDIEPSRMGVYLEIEAKIKEKNT